MLKFSEFYEFIVKLNLASLQCLFVSHRRFLLNFTFQMGFHNIFELIIEQTHKPRKFLVHFDHNLKKRGGGLPKKIKFLSQPDMTVYTSIESPCRVHSK
jgi:hypothetical protein